MINKISNCRVCGSASVSRTLCVKEMMFAMHDEFTYRLCSDCGSLSLAEDGFDMGPYYPSDYYSFVEKWEIAAKPRLVFAVGRLLPAAMVTQLARVFGNYAFSTMADLYQQVDSWMGRRVGRSPRILDVGCGNGAFLMKYHYAGFTVAGLDPFYFGADPKEFPIFRCPIEEHDRVYDLIILNASLEHMPAPTKILENVFRMLPPGGTCVALLPKLPSYGFDTYGENWFTLDAPRHYFIPSVTGVNLMAKSVGFTGVEVHQVQIPDELVWSEAYRRGIQRQGKVAKDIFTAEELKAFKARSNESLKEERSCHATFVMRKPRG